jgi:hypothetical protein
LALLIAVFQTGRLEVVKTALGNVRFVPEPDIRRLRSAEQKAVPLLFELIDLKLLIVLSASDRDQIGAPGNDGQLGSGTPS